MIFSLVQKPWNEGEFKDILNHCNVMESPQAGSSNGCALHIGEDQVTQRRHAASHSLEVLPKWKRITKSRLWEKMTDTQCRLEHFDAALRHLVTWRERIQASCTAALLQTQTLGRIVSKAVPQPTLRDRNKFNVLFWLGVLYQRPLAISDHDMELKAEMSPSPAAVPSQNMLSRARTQADTSLDCFTGDCNTSDFLKGYLSWADIFNVVTPSFLESTSTLFTLKVVYNSNDGMHGFSYLHSACE